jgi:hypothetical protein
LRKKSSILQEAKKRVGEKGYNLINKNCQHFVGQVRNNLNYSPEVESFFEKLIGFGLKLFDKKKNKKVKRLI